MQSAIADHKKENFMFYRHFKGRYYQAVAEALDTATEQTVIIYRTLYPSEYAWFTRPAEEFHGEKVTEDGIRVKRFAPVEYAQLPTEVQEYVNSAAAPCFS